MKKLIGFIGVWSLYFLGDLTSRLMYKKGLQWLYVPSCKLMIWSLNVQDWAKLAKPWEHVNKN